MPVLETGVLRDVRVQISLLVPYVWKVPHKVQMGFERPGMVKHRGALPLPSSKHGPVAKLLRRSVAT